MNRLYDKATDQWFEVSEEVFQEYSRECGRHRGKMQYYGRCRCPRRLWWRCDMTCMDCEYRTENMISLDAPTGDGEGTLMDVLEDSSPLIEDVLADRDLLDCLIRRMQEMLPDTDRLIALLEDKERLSVRAMARELGIPYQTFVYRLKRIREEMSTVRGGC